MKKVLLIVLLLFFSIPAYSIDANSDMSKLSIDKKIEEISSWINSKEQVENPNYEELSLLYSLRAYFYKTSKQQSHAFADIKISLKYNNKNYYAIHTLADLKEGVGDYQGALIELTKIINNAPSSFFDRYSKSELYEHRARINHSNNNLKAAIDDYTQAILCQNKNPTAFEGRGLLLILNNQRDKGIQDLIYAKQQYYELGDYDNYKSVTLFLNKLQNKNNKY